MSTQNPTIPFGSQSMSEGAQQDNSGKSNATAAAVATGAAAAAVGAAGYYAYTQVSDDLADDEVPVVEAEVEADSEVEAEVVSAEPAANAGTDVHTSTPAATAGNGAAHPSAPSAPAAPAAGAGNAPATPVVNADPAKPVVPAEPVVDDDPVVEPEPVVEPDPIVNPQIDVNENPDEIADALIAVEEIDPNDIDGAQPFTCTDLDTVYDIYGNATTQAGYIAEDGTSGVLIDLDNDGVFDQLTDDQSGIVYVVDDTFLTVGDAEFDVESGYIAYNEEQDSMIDDDPMDDIIDTEDLA